MSVGAVNKSTGDRIPTAGMPAIDAALSGSSTNPVQNMVVKAAFDAIKDGQSINSFADVETALGEKADTDIVASDFSAAASYTAGDYCIYEGKFYKFKANHSGAWAAADVDEIKIAGELSSLKSGLISATTINNQTIGNFLLSKVGHVVMISMSNGTLSTDSDGFVLLDGERLIIPSAYRPISTINIVESYAGKRISIDINGRIFLPNDLSATGLVVRFEAVYLAN